MRLQKKWDPLGTSCAISTPLQRPPWPGLGPIMTHGSRPAGESALPTRSTSSIQGPLFDRAHQRRDETELLHALTDALAVLVRSGAPDSALRESFVHAMAGLGAEKGVVVEVVQTQPLEVEILYATGMSPENEAACRTLRSSPGISPTLIRKAVEEGRPRLVENSQFLGLD